MKIKLDKYSLKTFAIVALCFALTVGLFHQANAQCPMCKMSAETNLKNGGKAGRGLNDGILYLFSMPYLLVGTFGVIYWYHNRKRREEEVLE